MCSMTEMYTICIMRIAYNFVTQTFIYLYANMISYHWYTDISLISDTVRQDQNRRVLL